MLITKIKQTTLFLLVVCTDVVTRTNGFTTHLSHESIRLNTVQGGIDRVSFRMSFSPERNRKRDRMYVTTFHHLICLPVESMSVDQ